MNKSLLTQIKTDFKEVTFRQGTKFLFKPPKTTVLGPPEEHDDLLLLHELGHFLCGHENFKTLPERLKKEREAWEKARELCKTYGITYDEDVVERELDTYRDWLHQKSLCKNCGLTRYQTKDGKFHCPRCEAFTTSLESAKISSESSSLPL